MFSKLINGNTYVLKKRDGRNVVSEMFILDPGRVRPMVGPDGSILYQLQRDILAGEQENIMVPASEIIHDRMNAFYHPLWGLSPIYANHLPAAQALRILKYSDRFFGNAARPSGVLTAPGVINKETADRLKAHWEMNYTAENQGKVAVLGDGLKFDPMTQNAVDAELVKQLDLSDKKVCTSFGVPPFKIGVEGAPTYDNVEAMDQIYYSGCLQIHIEQIERLLRSGLELPSGYYVEFDLDGLLRMDTARKVDAFAKMVGAGIVAPNEARAEFDYSPVAGGDTPYLQQQYYPLDKRPDNKPPPAPTPPAPSTPALPSAAAAKLMLRTIRRGLANV
jgi:HK97 family phage portal protein